MGISKGHQKAYVRLIAYFSLDDVAVMGFVVEKRKFVESYERDYRIGEDGI